MQAVRTAALTAFCLAGGFLTSPCLAQPAAGGSLALTRDDIYRGVSQTCGDPAAQADVHVGDGPTQSQWTAFAGVWGSAGLGRSRCGAAREVNAYAGYSLALTSDVTATVRYTRYAFPGGDYWDPHLSGRRYDYDQLDALWSIDERLFLTLAWTPDALSYERYERSLKYEQDRGAFAYGAQWLQPIASWLSLTASAGYDRMTDPFGTGYGYWSAGLTHTSGAFELDVGYFRTADRAVRLFGDQAAGGRVSATVLWRF